jgi:protein-disulfide isomerase
MVRRFFVQLFRRVFALILAICLGCAAQTASPELAAKVEHHVRAYYQVPPQVQLQISALKPSDFPNYDALTVTFLQGETRKNYDFLVSKDQKTLIRLTKLDLSKDPYADTMSKMDLKGRPTRGNPSAKVVAVNYDDFQCPYCSMLHRTLFPQILAEYGDRVLFVYKDFPLEEIHPWSRRASIDANCLFAQKNEAYWDFADYIHANQHEVSVERGQDAQFAKLDLITMQQGEKEHLDSAKLQACVKAQNDDAVKLSMHEAENLGIESTPTLYVNGVKLDGAAPVDQLRAIFDRALKEAGVPPPTRGITPTPAATAGAGPASR